MEKATEKVNFIIIELPKFRKTLRQLETRLDWWIYCIKHLGKLKKQPAKLHDEIFGELFETARINKLKDEDMGQYRKSVMDYEDVQVCMRDFGELNMERGLKRGLKKGLKKGLEEGRKEIVKNGLKEGLPMDILSRITGLTLMQISRIQT